MTTGLNEDSTLTKIYIFLSHLLCISHQYLLISFKNCRKKFNFQPHPSHSDLFKRIESLIRRIPRIQDLRDLGNLKIENLRNLGTRNLGNLGI